MTKYDDASWHYGGEYPAGLPNEAAGTHIGMFFAWCMLNGCASKEVADEVDFLSLDPPVFFGGAGSSSVI